MRRIAAMLALAGVARAAGRLRLRSVHRDLGMPCCNYYGYPYLSALSTAAGYPWYRLFARRLTAPPGQGHRW